MPAASKRTLPGLSTGTDPSAAMPSGSRMHSTYFCAAPVLNTTTSSSRSMSPRFTMSFSTARQIAVSGHRAMPSVRHGQRHHWGDLCIRGAGGLAAGFAHCG